MVTPWQAQFPTPYAVTWLAYTGQDSVTDELGNTVPAYAAPVTRQVQGWDLLSMETLDGHVAEEHLECFLMTPPDFIPGIKDRVVLPAGTFEVTGHDLEAASPSQWAPGNIIILKKVEG